MAAEPPPVELDKSYVIPKHLPDFKEWAKRCLVALETWMKLPELCGHMLKESPQLLRFGGKDRRYFKLRGMSLLWWESAEDADAPESAAPNGGPRCKGFVNFLANDCEAVIDPKCKDGFLVRTTGEGWAKGAMIRSKAEKRANRVFNFDTKGSEHSLETWLEVVQVHLRHANTLRSHKDEKAPSSFGSEACTQDIQCWIGASMRQQAKDTSLKSSDVA